MKTPKIKLFKALFIAFILAAIFFIVLPYYEMNEEIEYARQQKVQAERVAALNREIAPISIAGIGDEGIRQVWEKR